METKTYFDVAGQLVAKHPVDVVKLEMRFNSLAIAGCFWQVHDFAPSYSVTEPADGAVPIKSWPCYAGVSDYKDFTGAELHLKNGLYVCASEAEATKVIGTGNNSLAMLQVELVEDDVLAGATAVEDQATSLQVRPEPAAGAVANRLVRVKCTNLEAGIRYLHLYARNLASDGLLDGQKPLASWTMAATGDPGDSIDLRFGDGRWVRDNDGSGGTRRGIQLVISSTAATTTQAEGAGCDIYAEYL